MDNQIAVFEQKQIRQAEHTGEIYYRRNFETDTPVSSFPIKNF